MKRRNPVRWRAFEARLGRQKEIWMATVRGDGRPHLAPVWFIWLEEKIWISTGVKTQKFFNLRGNQTVSLALPDAMNVAIIEGEAHVAPRGEVDRVADFFFDKYEWDFRFDESAKWQLIEITPLKIMVWGDGHESEGTRIF